MLLDVIIKEMKIKTLSFAVVLSQHIIQKMAMWVLVAGKEFMESPLLSKMLTEIREKMKEMVILKHRMVM